MSNKTLKTFLKNEIILQAILVGLISGLLVVLFKISINSVFNIITKHCFHWYIFPLITTLGGLISGFLVSKYAPEAKGSGIPYVKSSLMHLGNLTRVRSIFVKFFGGIASIGTGMPLGREGPSVQLGAGSGALIGKLFKLSGTNKDKLISAGAGSAIAATFNAPIAGTIFVLEELMQKFSSSILFPVLIATVTASSIARYILGDKTSFQIPEISGTININIVICIIIGVVSGGLGVVFSKLIHKNNSLFQSLKTKPYLKTAIAGLFVGVFGLFVPQVLGSGTNSVDSLLINAIPITLVLVILLLKFLLTPFCFGSGAVGGIFLPMLMIGAYIGYVLGYVSNILGFEVNIVVTSLIGMAAFLSAVARTPITATVMVFEMTGGYNFILFIMLACAIADLTAGKLKHKPIYSELIVNQEKSSSDAKILDSKKVSDVMVKSTKTIKQTSSLVETLDKMRNENVDFYPVVDEKNNLIGTIQKEDIEDVLINCGDKPLKIQDIMNSNIITANKDLDLYTLYFRLHSNNCNNAVVVNQSHKVLGTVSRYDIQKVL